MTQRPHKRSFALVVALLSTWACASPPQTQPAWPNDPVEQQGSSATSPSDPLAELPDVDAGPSVFQRAASALEGALVGAVMGAQAGPLGAAVGAGTLLVYAAVTGEVPMLGGGDPNPPDARNEQRREREMEEQIDAEVWGRGSDLEDEIDVELFRQEQLLREIEKEQAATREEQRAPVETPRAPTLAASTGARAAPAAPAEPALPRALFEARRVRVASGVFGNERELQVIELSLDADGDGSPEILHFHDPETDELIRSERDSDFDGRIDVWDDYAAGEFRKRRVDRDGDGHADLWEEYAEGWMTRRKVDRNGDGSVNEYYQWSGGSLLVERHDPDGDGQLNRVIRYQDGLRVRAEEDLDADGRMDRVTTYANADGAEVAVRIERDSNGDGSMDVIESYAAVSGPPVLLRREEDRDADGRVDVTSIYEEGRLVRREIGDPSLVPL